MTFRQYLPSGSFDFVLLITFRRPVSQTMSFFLFLALNRVRSPYSCNTFLPVNYSQATRDRRQTETRFHLACHTPTRLSTTNDIDNVFTVRRRG
ncbi:hypothetical protein K443DRAFT_685774 [Laccaria amethystina LaAM-08-1]|uniref:Uncharacterized protein n=1 Tax=Laccaria amethystina LaAM-08-1 TaxID=1095629 RepID=A0A0C9WTP6_9AGAR|nr:hypothetical protein K443DRAFT_685774 [Laccaria amethystina LaAM-08-1]